MLQLALAAPRCTAKSKRTGKLYCAPECEVSGSAGCTALAVVRLKASGTEITGTAPGRRKQSNFGSSSNRFADECPLLGVKRTLRRPGARRYAISDGGLASGSALDARYPRCKVIVAPCTSAFASCDLIVTDCLSPRVTKFKLAVNVGPLATT